MQNSIRVATGSVEVLAVKRICNWWEKELGQLMQRREEKKWD